MDVSPKDFQQYLSTSTRLIQFRCALTQRSKLKWVIRLLRFLPLSLSLYMYIYILHSQNLHTTPKHHGGTVQVCRPHNFPGCCRPGSVGVGQGLVTEAAQRIVVSVQYALNCGFRVIYAGFHTFSCLRIRGRSYSNFWLPL